MKTKLILSIIILLSIFGFAGTAKAIDSSVYVFPTSLTKTVGNVFNVSVGFNATGNKVCAVEGTLVFNNISCQSITVASDMMAQTSPTCSNPHFLIGVPSCSLSDKVLMTVSVKAKTVGTASISLTGVDILGEGVSVGSTATIGTYTINPVPAPAPAPANVPEPKNVKDTEDNTIEEKDTVDLGDVEEENLLVENSSANLLGAVGADKTSMASLADSLTSPTAIWLAIILLLAAACFLIVKKFWPRKKG